MNLTNLQKAVSALPREKDLSVFGMSVEHREVLIPLMCELGVMEPRVDDLSAFLNLQRGKVLAVRWDVACGDIGFKLPVFASLLLFHLWNSRRDLKDVRFLTDGGNVSSALAMSALASKLGLRAEHVISWQFPQDIRDYMTHQAGGVLDLIAAPNIGGPREREFYGHLLQRMASAELRQERLCLWHAKYSAMASKWLGTILAAKLPSGFDDLVLSLGAGTTLGGYAIPIKEAQCNHPRITVAEHELSPLINGKAVVVSLERRNDAEALTRAFRPPTSDVPHMVLGPHYDELNDMLTSDQFEHINGVARYSDSSWQSMSQRCIKAGIPVGNSSAANIAVAEHLANQGRSVLTFLYEPLRPFYLQSPMLPFNDWPATKSSLPFSAASRDAMGQARIQLKHAV